MVKLYKSTENRATSPQNTHWGLGIHHQKRPFGISAMKSKVRSQAGGYTVRKALGFATQGVRRPTRWSFGICHRRSFFEWKGRDSAKPLSLKSRRIGVKKGITPALDCPSLKWGLWMVIAGRNPEVLRQAGDLQSDPHESSLNRKLE